MGKLLFFLTAFASMLKQQIAELQEEFRRNESHWHAAHGKLKNQIEMLTKQNLELRDELRVSEHQRLEAEKKSGAVDFISRKSETPVLKDLLSVGGYLSSGSVWYTNVRAIQSFKISVMHQSSLNEQRTYGRKSPVLPVSHLTVSKETNSSSYIKGKISCKPYISMAMICGNFPPASSGLQVSVRLLSFKQNINSSLSLQIYYYADAETTHTTYPNGLEVLQFPNNQIEKHHPDGTKEIVFPDQTVKRFYDGGLEETVFPDGTVVKVEKNGDKMVMFSNGQKEIHTSQFKRREYPDGTIKTVYSSGQQETKYSSGRVRIKDKEGNIILNKK
uniref:Centromere protein J C-terminal domain-containing protein n=1 Tax=Chelonoidis abingdonii TaxID=106734 RepID=A0A8C0H1G7_CHEAB